jgi:hypothetical protein
MTMRDSKEALRKLLRQLARTEEEELDCGQVYKLLDLYTEAAARGEDPSELFPKVAQHLEICLDCQDEYEALLRVLKSLAD